MTYLGKNVFEFIPDFGQTVEHGQLDDFAYDSISGGMAVPWKVTSLPRRSISLPFLLDGLPEIKQFRSFFAAMDGRAQSFWLPTWITDYALVKNQDAGDTTILINAVGVSSKIALSDAFEYLALLTPTKIELYHIESVATIDGNEQLTLDRGLDSDLTSRSTVCCGAMLVRLADDDIAYEYISGSCVQVGLKFVEVPAEVFGEAVVPTRDMCLYRIIRGSLVWRFTNWPASVTIGSDVWTAADIEQGELTYDIEFASDTVDLTIVTDDPEHPIRKLLSSNLIIESQVEIFECDASTLDPDFDAPIYIGRVGQTEFETKGQVNVHLSSLLRIGEHQGPSPQIQRVCNHNTYDARCGLNAVDFTTTGTVTAVSGYTVAADEFGAKATLESDPNWFALGQVTSGEETRLCVGANGNTLYLNAPFDAVQVGDSISALAGDDKRAATCLNKFDNIENQLAFPYLPNSNPQFQALTVPQKKGGKK